MARQRVVLTMRQLIDFFRYKRQPGTFFTFIIGILSSHTPFLSFPLLSSPLLYLISYHIISYHIISYHIISFHIISYRVTLLRSNCVLCFRLVDSCTDPGCWAVTQALLLIREHKEGTLTSSSLLLIRVYIPYTHMNILTMLP